MSPYHFTLCVLTMIAFAGNSILNRMALIGGESGAWGFTLIRLVSAMVVLIILMEFSRSAPSSTRNKSGNWRGALSLGLYGVGFSYAYIELDAGIGALILFTVVQMTMLGWGLKLGERLSALQILGGVVAFGAMLWLLGGGADIARPNPWGVLSMTAAGIGWGIYSLLGRNARDALAATSGNFTRAALIAIGLTPVIIVCFPEQMPSYKGIMIAVVSGGLTSGLGYAIWYSVLPHISRMQAGLMQLSVPAIAALGGWVLLSEPLTLHMISATILILLGVALATLGPNSEAVSE